MGIFTLLDIIKFKKVSVSKKELTIVTTKIIKKLVDLLISYILFKKKSFFKPAVEPLTSQLRTNLNLTLCGVFLFVKI